MTSAFLLTSAFFHRKPANFAILINKYRHKLHSDTLFLILLTSFEYLKIFLIKMLTILTISAKMAT